VVVTPVTPPTFSEKLFSFGQQASDFAQSVVSNTPQTLNSVRQNIEQVVNEHGPVALEHLNNIVTELQTNHIPRVMNEADKFAQKALTIHIPQACEKLKQAKTENLPKLTRWVKDHRAETAGVVASGAVSILPELVTGPLLWAAGFRGLGPVGGEYSLTMLGCCY